MRLSDIKGEDCFEVMAKIAAPALNIALDENARKAFAGQGEERRKTLTDSLPVLMESHKDDLIEIFAGLSRKTREEYLETLDLPKLTVDTLELLTDQVFADFLPSPGAETE